MSHDAWNKQPPPGQGQGQGPQRPPSQQGPPPQRPPSGQGPPPQGIPPQGIPPGRPQQVAGYPQQAPGYPQQRPVPQNAVVPQTRPAQKSQLQSKGSFNGLDFNRISDMPSKYPRKDLPENLEQNMQLGGTYQSFIFRMGNCCGTLRMCLPCLCCVEYPYKQIDQSFVGIYQRFGRYVKTMGSGLQYFNPFTDTITIIDMKTNIINLNRLNAITRDNIQVRVDAAVYYHIKIPRKTYYSVENIQRSVQELTFSTLRSIAGHYALQELLEKREQVTLELGKFVARQVHEWGIEITNILIKDIILNQELQDILAAVAKEKRLAESKILNAIAEVESARLMRQTADILSGKAAMQIRYLEAVQNMATNPNVRVVFLAEEG